MAGTRAQGFTTALTDIDISPQEYLGMIRADYEKSYKYVQFTGTTAVNIGDVVCYTTADQNQRTVDGANTALGAGVAVAAHPAGSVSYGWIQVNGVATLSTAIGGAVAVGNYVSTVGAAAPAVTLAAALTSLIAGYVVNVAGRVIYCQFPD